MGKKMEPIELDVSMQIGLLQHQLRSKAVTNIHEVSGYIHRLKKMQMQQGLFGYDRYPENSSAPLAAMKSPEQEGARDCTIWSVNHYLGLNRHPKVIEAGKKAMDLYGTGCGTSGVSGGLCQLHRDIEAKMAHMLAKESAIVFPTGYSANVGAISALASVGKTLILIDREAHASIIDGCKLSSSRYLPFRHNDVEDLEKKLARYQAKYENIIVIIETAYSMTGNVAPLQEIAELKEKYSFLLYVDEAHSFGFYGENGRGMCYEAGISDAADVIMTTLSKSTASIGGIVATSRAFCDFLQFYATSYLFQACLPPATAASVLAALDIIQEEPEHAKRLHANNSYFRQKLLAAGFDLGNSASPIIPVYVREPDKLYNMERELYKEGVFTVALTYPAVKFNEVRFRFIVSASHTRKHIDKAFDVLERLGKKYEVIV